MTVKGKLAQLPEVVQGTKAINGCLSPVTDYALTIKTKHA